MQTTFPCFNIIIFFHVAFFSLKLFYTIKIFIIALSLNANERIICVHFCFGFRRLFFTNLIRVKPRDIANSRVNRCTCPVFVRAKSCDFWSGLDTEKFCISRGTARRARTCSRAFHATSEIDRIQNNRRREGRAACEHLEPIRKFAFA